MTLPDHLLDILCCPVSHEPLLPLSRAKLKTLNDAIESGGIESVDHEPITETLSDALITRNHKVVYPIAEGIPVLLAERGIGTTQLSEPI